MTRYAIIGDVHGCDDELQALLTRLSQRNEPPRQLVFVGDLVDRGPHIVAVLLRVMALCARGEAQCVRGNHDDKLLRALRGAAVQRGNGLQASLDQLSVLDASQLSDVVAFLDALPYQLLLDGGRLVVAHAGLPAHLHGDDSRRTRAFALYGDTTGQVDALGHPQRRDWAAAYAGAATVVYGHTPVDAAVWRNRTLNIDTGCVFGGMLTAVLYPEGETISVPAVQSWWPPPPSPAAAPPPERQG